MTEQSWRQMARKLALRLANHAYCDYHAITEQQPGICPFCNDRATYLQWETKERAALAGRRRA